MSFETGIASLRLGRDMLATAMSNSMRVAGSGTALVDEVPSAESLPGG